MASGLGAAAVTRGTQGSAAFTQPMRVCHRWVWSAARAEPQMPPLGDDYGAPRVLRRAPREGSPRQQKSPNGAFGRASALCALWARAPWRRAHPRRACTSAQRVRALCRALARAGADGLEPGRDSDRLQQRAGRSGALGCGARSRPVRFARVLRPVDLRRRARRCASLRRPRCWGAGTSSRIPMCR
jgi:hypothetical protein